LVAVRAKKVEILADRRTLAELHAPRETPQHRASLVLRKVVSGTFSQYVEHAAQRLQSLRSAGIGGKLVSGVDRTVQYRGQSTSGLIDVALSQ
jgi:hypothetical protein